MRASTSLTAATTRWRWIALSTLLVATVSLPFAARYVGRCASARRAREALTREVPWRTVGGCTARTTTHACKVGPVEWALSARADGTALALAQIDGPLVCALDDPHTRFAYRVDANGRDAEYRCVTRDATGAASITAVARYRIAVNANAGPAREVPSFVLGLCARGYGACGALLLLALVAACARRRPDARDLQRPWREANAEGDGTATLDDGTHVHLPHGVASAARGTPLLLVLDARAAHYRDGDRVAEDAYRLGTRASLEAEVATTARHRWKLVTVVSTVVVVTTVALAAAGHFIARPVNLTVRWVRPEASWAEHKAQRLTVDADDPCAEVCAREAELEARRDEVIRENGYFPYDPHGCGWCRDLESTHHRSEASEVKDVAPPPRAESSVSITNELEW